MMKKIILLLIFSAVFNHVHAQKTCTKPFTPQISILIDLSEPLDKPTAIAFSTFSKKIVDSVPSGGRLNVYTIKLNAEEVDEKPDYEICIPDFKNMKGDKYRERAKQKFEQEVLPNLERLGNTVVSAKKSPIIENIFKISHATMLKVGPSEQHSLIVISDFVQYSDLADFYKDIPNYEAFAANQRSSAWLPKVGGTKMHMILLNNASSSKINLKKVRGFWLDYAKSNFKQCGFSGINEASVSFKNDC